MQKKLIAAAVAGALVAPSAMAEVAVSGSIRNGVVYDGSEVIQEANSSRWRIRANSDLGNGQSVFVTYEFTLDSSNATHIVGNEQRLSLVGIKGDWGQLSLGSQWATVWNTVGTYMDPVFYFGAGGWGADFRVADSVYYMGNFGGLTIHADASMTPETGADIDTSSIGASMGIGGLTLAGTYSNRDDGNDLTAIGGTISLGGFTIMGGWKDEDIDGSGISASVSIGSLRVTAWDADSAADSNVSAEYSIGLGGGASAIVGAEYDGTDTTAGAFLRYDF